MKNVLGYIVLLSLLVSCGRALYMQISQTHP